MLRPVPGRDDVPVGAQPAPGVKMVCSVCRLPPSRGFLLRSEVQLPAFVDGFTSAGIPT